MITARREVEIRTNVTWAEYRQISNDAHRGRIDDIGR